jgi:hypothetical protein
MQVYLVCSWRINIIHNFEYQFALMRHSHDHTIVVFAVAMLLVSIYQIVKELNEIARCR